MAHPEPEILGKQQPGNKCFEDGDNISKHAFTVYVKCYLMADIFSQINNLVII